MRLFLLRHGQTHANVSGSLDTARPGPELTDLGHAQANAAGTVLADRGIEAIYCSTLIRTEQTAAPLVTRTHLTPTVLDGLREVGAGDLEKRTDEDSAQAYRHVIAEWLFEQKLDSRMPGGESAHEFLARYDAAVDSILAAGHRNALIVSHGAAIRTWAGLRAAPDIASRWREQALGPLLNTGCIELEYDGSWRVVDWHNHPIGGDLLEDPGAADPTSRA